MKIIQNQRQKKNRDHQAKDNTKKNEVTIDQEQSKQQEDRIKIAIDAGHQKKQMSEKKRSDLVLIRQNRWYPQEPKVLSQNEQNIR